MTLKRGSPPPRLFAGTNFMTPNVEAYYQLRDGYWAELSCGTGMQNQPIFGVTVRPENPHAPKSKLFYSAALAMDYIEELS